MIKLQEQISKIQSMMGVITENRMDKVIQNMIDEVGIEGAFKMVDDFNLIDQHLTNEDRIKYIKDQVNEINDGNSFSLEQIWQRPIHYKIEDGVKHQIERLAKDYVTVVKYPKNGGTRSYYPKYEELPTETIIDLFKMLVSQYLD